jgi:type II secretion system protein G
MNRNRAFTLIELLIVVAIIAILAAIAVPNFLEAQTRSKVVRASADMRSLATAIEAYRVDNNRYPPASTPANFYLGYYKLTSPIAYMTTLPPDLFQKPDYIYGQAYAWNRVPDGFTGDRADYFAGFNNPVNGFFHRSSMQWQLQSPGPDRAYSNFDYPPYDPTNGTVSRGDLFRWGP